MYALNAPPCIIIPLEGHISTPCGAILGLCRSIRPTPTHRNLQEYSPLNIINSLVVIAVLGNKTRRQLLHCNASCTYQTQQCENCYLTVIQRLQNLEESNASVVNLSYGAGKVPLHLLKSQKQHNNDFTPCPLYKSCPNFRNWRRSGEQSLSWTSKDCKTKFWDCFGRLMTWPM